jgi:hypothetical protein
MLKYIVLLFALVPNIATANFEFSPSLSVFKTDKEESSSQVELRMGYTFESGLYAGGYYSIASDRFIEYVNQYYLGIHLGYSYKGLYALAGYALTGEQDFVSGGVKYSRPEAYSATLGYRMEVTTNVFLGPEFTWRQVEYTSREVQGVPQGDTGRKDTHVLPSITLQFIF